MAKLFPALNPGEIDNPGERVVARALVEQLPDRIEIFHSFNWLGRNRQIFATSFPQVTIGNSRCP